MAEPTEASSSASLSAYYNYDVFLSFRGTDTRNSFTGFLHKALKKEGIDVFIDNENLWSGEAIGPALIRAIEGSKISIPVFSNGYASSKWCLLELSQILKCHKSNGQVVLPIFLDVEPSDVRHQTGSLEGPFQEHEKNFTSVMVESWREALRVVGSLKGWVLNKDTNGDQAALVDLVVEKVQSELNSSIHLDACKHPIGIDSHINYMLPLLNSDSNDVQFVGICGFGGIGKTTIAKAVYNHILLNFKGRSFISDVREQAIQCNGLASLQKRLLKDITKRDTDIGDYHRGKFLMKEKLCKEKVLLVLDDVDTKGQIDALAGGLNWFGKGSRVIITTRDAQILDVAKVDKDKIYYPQELNSKDSLQLFSLYAFSMNQPPDDYRKLSKRVVSYSGGLPLAIEVLGSYLSSISSKEVWRSTLQKLKEFPHAEIQRRLKISYDNLEDDFQKSIFLDSACFFIGWEEKTVISIWEACGYYPKSAIHILIKRSLLKFEHGYLMMHDQIRDMGRNIVLEENLMEPSKRSRLWSHGEILQLLEGPKGTDKIKGMILPNGLQSVYLTSEHFEMMSNLRILDINSVNFGGDFSLLSSTLSWFRWKNCPLDILPANFYHKRLVHLDLSCSMIDEAWNIRPQDESKLFQNLRVLVLSDCIFLTKSPDFSWFPYLEQLDLGECKSLDKLDESIGQLSQLKILILKQCNSLKKLPDSIGDLKSLVELHCEDCFSLVRVPDLSRLKNLAILRLEGCIKLEEIRGLEGKLSLVEFNARGCHNLTVPPRKILGQGRLIHYRPQLGRFSLTASDGIYKKRLILCLVLELPSDFRSQTIYCDISASIHQKDKTTRCVHTLRLEDIEFTPNGDIIYLHYFKGFDWFGIRLRERDAVKNLNIHQSKFSCQLYQDSYVFTPYCTVKYWNLLVEGWEPYQKEPNQLSNAMMVAKFFIWSSNNTEPDQQNLNRHWSVMRGADLSNRSSENREYEQKLLNQQSSAMMVADFFNCSYVDVNDGEFSPRLCLEVKKRKGKKIFKFEERNRHKKSLCNYDIFPLYLFLYYFLFFLLIFSLLPNMTF